MSEETAKIAWDTFNLGVKLLDEQCRLEGITLQLKIPKLGAVKKKPKPSEPQRDSNAG